MAGQIGGRDADLIDQKLFEYGGAPLAVHRALCREEPVLAPILNDLAAPGSVSARIAGLLDYPPESFTDGWVSTLCGAARRREPVTGGYPGRQSQRGRFRQGTRKRCAISCSTPTAAIRGFFTNDWPAVGRGFSVGLGPDNWAG